MESCSQPDSGGTRLRGTANHANRQERQCSNILASSCSHWTLPGSDFQGRQAEPRNATQTETQRIWQTYFFWLHLSLKRDTVLINAPEVRRAKWEKFLPFLWEPFTWCPINWLHIDLSMYEATFAHCRLLERIAAKLRIRQRCQCSLFLTLQYIWKTYSYFC